MAVVKPTIVRTADGTHTLRHPVFGDTYHSLHGAVAESQHVFIHNGLRYVMGWGGGTPIRVLEMGFGSGLNAWLTLREAGSVGRAVEYTALELYPIASETATALGYTDDPVFAQLHVVPWGVRHRVTPWFSLEKIEADLTLYTPGTIFDLIYFDAFAPDTQPQLWSETVFRKLYGQITDGGVLVTYSAKGEVKRALRAAGFEVIRLPGAPGKRHMLRAVRPSGTGTPA